MAILVIVIIGDDGHQNQYRVLRTAPYRITRINHGVALKGYRLLFIPVVRDVIVCTFILWVWSGLRWFLANVGNGFFLVF